ncbi:hypothetical protein HDG40_002903 [Paraburkholderia sp. JPY158]|uniref:Uncharacterized protein n=1 Tax=Paraburkholderia atlantica TaxID=2654982 RepID=A0A7W8Q7M9_PARAM|nr:hypothetical protein [Paraburkholderia atlantica]
MAGMKHDAWRQTCSRVDPVESCGGERRRKRNASRAYIVRAGMAGGLIWVKHLGPTDSVQQSPGYENNADASMSAIFSSSSRRVSHARLIVAPWVIHTASEMNARLPSAMKAVG